MEQDINGKVQKINEEDYEIIKKFENDGYMQTVEWYRENYDCGLSEAKETVRSIKDKYGISYHGSIDDVKNMLLKIDSWDNAIKWYQDRYAVDSKEADKILMEICAEMRKEQGEEVASSGCMITILIAITSTLSVFCLL